MDKGVSLFFAFHDHQYSSTEWEILLQKAPTHRREEISTFVRWQDRQAKGISYLLLRKALIAYGYSEELIESETRDRYGKPSLQVPVTYNVSHAGTYVVLAVTDKGQIGIDIEEVRPIELQDFVGQFTAQEWHSIQESPNSLFTFYTYWTKKESVIKADGRGLSLNLQQIECLYESVFVEGVSWYLHQLTFSPNYLCSLATSFPADKVECIQVYLEEIIL